MLTYAVMYACKYVVVYAHFMADLQTNGVINSFKLGPVLLRRNQQI